MDDFLTTTSEGNSRVLVTGATGALGYKHLMEVERAFRILIFSDCDESDISWL